MKILSWRNSGLLSFCLVLLVACTKTPLGSKLQDGEGLNKDRGAVLANIADNIIIPAYSKFQVVFADMVTKSNSFTNNPTESTLADFRSSWQQAYIEWQKVEQFDVGPAETYTVRYFFNIYPASVDGINSNINNPSVNLELPSTYASQGFPALDYLLNGLGNTDTEILSFYTTDPGAAKRLAYIKRLTDHMGSLLNLVVSGWNGSYRDGFVAKTNLDVNSSTSLLVNGLTRHYERYIRSGKFGIPSGAMLNGVVSPEKVEGFYKKDLSGILATAAHQAYIDLFNGKSVLTGIEGPSFKTYLDGLNAKDPSTGTLLSSIINTQFEASQNKIETLRPNYHDQILSDNQAMKDTYNELQNSVRLLKVDMSSAMSITITYTDNDGD